MKCKTCKVNEAEDVDIPWCNDCIKKGILGEKITDYLEAGKKLLELFRKEQEIHGNIGCRCSTCEENMAKALRRFEEEKE